MGKGPQSYNVHGPPAGWVVTPLVIGAHRVMHLKKMCITVTVESPIIPQTYANQIYAMNASFNILTLISKIVKPKNL